MAAYQPNGFEMFWNTRKDWTASQSQQALQSYNDLLAQYSDTTREIMVAGEMVSKDELQRRIVELKNSLAKQYDNQGLTTGSYTDANGVYHAGTLTNVNDMKDQFIDKDYLREVEQKGSKAENAAVSQVSKAIRQASLKGGTAPSAGEMAAAQESANRNTNNQLLSAIKGEVESGYQKAQYDTGRKEAFAKQLSDAERQSALDQLNSYITNMQTALSLSDTQVKQWQAQLAAEPDGLLVDLLAGVAKSGVQYLTGQLFGGNMTGEATTGGSVPKSR